MLKIDDKVSKIALFPGKTTFEKIWSFVLSIDNENKRRKNPVDIIMIAENPKFVKVSARLYGFSFVETKYDEVIDELTYGHEHSFSSKRCNIRCFAQTTEAGKNKILECEKVDLILKGSEL